MNDKPQQQPQGQYAPWAEDPDPPPPPMSKEAFRAWVRREAERRGIPVIQSPQRGPTGK